MFTPVTASWDEGASLRSAISPLIAAGYRVDIFDTLSMLRRGDGFHGLVDRWARYLASGSTVPDLLAGNALGGALVQSLLEREWTHRAKVLLISGPTIANEELNSKLEHVASIAAQGAKSLEEALDALEEFVRGPLGTGTSRPRVPVGDAELAAWRISTGLRLLRDIDTSQAVRAFPGPLAHIYGEQSLLVQQQHVAIGRYSHHHELAVPLAGMRPHIDQPFTTQEVITKFLGLTQVQERKAENS